LLDEVIAAAMAGLQAMGFDPYAGRKLFGLLHRAGFEQIETTVHPYHLIAGQVSPTERARWQLKLDILMPALTRILGQEASARTAVRSFMNYLDRPDTLTYSVAFCVRGRRPGAEAGSVGIGQ